MRGLAEDDAAALLRVELLRAAQPVEEIRVVLRVDHLHGAVHATGDDLARARDGRVEAVAVTDDHAHAGAIHGVVHRAAFGERDGHRLLDQYVLSLRRRRRDVRGVQTVRCGDIDDVDRGVGAQRFDAVVRPRAELGRKARRRLLPRIRSGDQANARIGDEGRHHQREGAAEPGHADVEAAWAHRASTLSTASIELSIVT